MKAPHKVEFSIPVEPLAVQSVRRGRFGFYAPPKVKAWKKTVHDYVQEHFPHEPYEGPLKVVYVKYVFPFPKTLKKSIKEKIANGETFYMDRRGDLMDNLNKGTMDALAGVVFVDDAQIVQCGGSEKIYGDPHIEISFEDLSGQVNVLPK